MKDDRATSASMVTPIKYAEEIRFSQPAQERFPILGSITSILSLMLMSAVSIIISLQLIKPEINLLGQTASLLSISSLPQPVGGFPLWVLLPFVLTIYGSMLGWIFELCLLTLGIPFQMTQTKLSRAVVKLRVLNIAPVIMSMLFFTSAFLIQDEGLRMAMLLITFAGVFSLGIPMYFGPPNAVVPMLLLGSQILQICIVLICDWNAGSSFIIAMSALQFVALLIGTATPARSTAFHVLCTTAALIGFVVILKVSALNGQFFNQGALSVSLDNLSGWGFISAGIAGLVIGLKAFPASYANLRASFTNKIWSTIYYGLVSGPRFPNPFSLKTVYANTQAVQSRLRPYYQAHPEKDVFNLRIPAVDVSNIEANVTRFKGLEEQASKGFAVIRMLDGKMPQSDISVSLKDKARLEVWSSGEKYWPSKFSDKKTGAKLPDNGQLDLIPNAALETFGSGQLLAYLAESGVANPFLQPVSERGPGALMIDFRSMESYKTKPEFESYGGIAYFCVNVDTEKLELVSVIAPNSKKEISVNVNDPAFRHAERLLAATIYFRVISGKHLAEIHMTMNLIEVSMHNAFDVPGQWSHPVRTMLYLHFFAHELAEELTTAHLVQDNAVFSQVFATTHDSLIQHLNDTYSSFEYGADEDFESRVAIMTMPGKNGEDGKILPNACVKWELDYFAIWHKYTTSIIDITYSDDKSVQEDTYLQNFHSSLLDVLINGFPERYDNFQSKKGVARFAADTIHHIVVRHQVYGTCGVRAALDPRVSQTQVPCDAGTTSIDDWRSLAFVALATAKSKFTLLTGPDGQDFSYLLEGVDESMRGPMAKVFSDLQSELQALEKDWTVSEADKVYNYDHFRPLPSELRTGAGY
ncbi:MAG TPA: hypothetical protein DCE52_18395 [Rhodobacteraceae bacterium]|nr:hypothetical protein [Paracoccaceae bacterium]